MATEFKLPELGENIESGDLVRLMIKPGASITAGDAVMELETDKAVVEVPSSVTGTVGEIRVKEGDKLKVGQVIFTVENGAGTASAPAAKAAPKQKSKVEKIAAQAIPSPKTSSGRASEPPAASAPPQPDRRAKAPASQPTEFKLPELGENIDSGDLVRLMISPGATVSEGQPVMELETDKAVVEVPSTVSGVVREIKVKEGQKVKVGEVIFTLEGGVVAAPEPSRKHEPVEHVTGAARSTSLVSTGDARRRQRPKNRRCLRISRKLRRQIHVQHAGATGKSCRHGRSGPSRAACAPSGARNWRRHSRRKRQRSRWTHQRR